MVIMIAMIDENSIDNIYVYSTTFPNKEKSTTSRVPRKTLASTKTWVPGQHSSAPRPPGLAEKKKELGGLLRLSPLGMQLFVLEIKFQQFNNTYTNRLKYIYYGYGS